MSAERILIVERYMLNGMPPMGVRYEAHMLDDGSGACVYYPGSPQACYVPKGVKLAVRITPIANGAVEVTISAIGEFDGPTNSPTPDR